MKPVVVHVVRPYESDRDYLAAEAWSIDARSMLLIDAQPLPADTAVLFDVALSDGRRVIRAEGRVVGLVAASGGRPGGLTVRFRRFGAATKAFVERAVALRIEGSEPQRANRPLDVSAREPTDSRVSNARQRHLPGPVSAPSNRDELLARLRGRSRAG